jgi:hypothetical protein
VRPIPRFLSGDSVSGAKRARGASSRPCSKGRISAHVHASIARAPEARCARSVHPLPLSVDSFIETTGEPVWAEVDNFLEDFVDSTSRFDLGIDEIVGATIGEARMPAVAATMRHLVDTRLMERFCRMTNRRNPCRGSLLPAAAVDGLADNVSVTSVPSGLLNHM